MSGRAEMRDYLVIFEKGERNWGAFSPDVPGCIDTGKSKAEVKRRMRTAMLFHIEGLLKMGLPVPKPTCVAENVCIAM